MPTVRLYGKDGPSGRHQLPITTQVDFSIKAGGEPVSVTMFVQPDSTQECLLGTNASLPLGFKFVGGDGRPLRTSVEPQPMPEPDSDSEPKVAHVSLIESVSIPSRKCRFLKAKVSGEYAPGDHLFESRDAQLRPLGASAIDAMVTLNDEGVVLIPVQNFETCSVDLPGDVELGVVERFKEGDGGVPIPLPQVHVRVCKLMVPVTTRRNDQESCLACLTFRSVTALVNSLTP